MTEFFNDYMALLFVIAAIINLIIALFTQKYSMHCSIYAIVCLVSASILLEVYKIKDNQEQIVEILEQNVETHIKTTENIESLVNNNNDNHLLELVDRLTTVLEEQEN